MPYTLLIANDFPPVTSGIATVFSEIWRRLPPDRTRILAPKMKDTAHFDKTYPIPLHRVYLPLGESGKSKLLKTLLTGFYVLLKTIIHRPSRIHCGQVFSSGITGLICKRLLGIPYNVWVYGSETTRLAQGGRTAKLMHRILENSDWVIANSNMTVQEFKTFGVPESKIRRIYPGVDPIRFSPAPKDKTLLDKLDGHNKRILLTIARLDQRKGHDMVLQAMAHLPEDVIYLIGGSGREEARLRQLSQERNLSHRVHFLGFVPDNDLPQLYNLCDVFVMPNRITEGTPLEGDIEGFGITFIEAGACEKPVVAGRSGGAVEAVIDGQTGLLVNPKSETDIADAILKFLNTPTFAQKIGHQSRQRILSELDWHILAKQVEDIL